MTISFIKGQKMTTSLFFLALLGLSAVHLYVAAGEIEPRYHSCAELYKSNVARASAEYTIYNCQNQPFQVYCEFHHGYGYTFISPATNVQVNIDDLYTETDHVIIRNLRTDNKQYVVKLEQLTKYSNIPISIQYNSHNGYNAIKNSRMAPYIYIGLLPIAMQHLYKVEGYKVNGQEITFTNCDGLPNSYFAFLFNHNHAGITPYASVDLPLVHEWVDRSLPSDPADNLPNGYYSGFEVHQGGCGGYGIKPDFPHLKGAAVGIRFDVKCPAPQNVPHSTHNATGSTIGNTVTYTCYYGYRLLTGSHTLVCGKTGIWVGTAPICGQDPCDSGPCYNGGTCANIEGTDSFLCECSSAFSGKQCQLPL